MRSLCLVAVTLCASAGCTFTMVGNAPKTEQPIAHERTVNATFTNSEQFINVCEEEGDLAEIRFHTNPGYLLVSVLSFGLYVPQHVTWWCGAAPTE